MEKFLYVLLFVMGLVVVVSILMQESKADALSGLVQGAKNDSFFSKNKSRTKEAMIERVTIISMITFILTIIAINLIK